MDRKERLALQAENTKTLKLEIRELKKMITKLTHERDYALSREKTHEILIIGLRETLSKIRGTSKNSINAIDDHPRRRRAPGTGSRDQRQSPKFGTSYRYDSETGTSIPQGQEKLPCKPRKRKPKKKPKRKSKR